MEKSGEHAGTDVGALQRGARQGDAGDRGRGQGGQGAQAQTQGQKVRNWMTGMTRTSMKLPQLNPIKGHYEKFQPQKPGSHLLRSSSHLFMSESPL